MTTEDDHDLLRLLSARSYLSADGKPSANRDSTPSTAPSPDKANTDKVNTRSISPPMDSTRVTRQRRSSRNVGRPRLDSQGTAVLSESRRKQIRQAQKTYRLKKEATMRSAQAQLTELKQKINGISEAFSELYHAALESDLKNTHPTLFDHFDGVKRLLAADTEELPTSSLQNVSSTGRWAASSAPKSVMSTPESATGSQPRSPSQQHVFGYCPMPSISPLSTETTPGSASLSPEDYHEPNQTHDNRQNTWGSFGKPVYTYCFQEATFSRRLQRYCLEHAFRLFSDPRSHPNGIYQVFRLVPCIQNKAKMYPHFKRLVMAGSGDSLEIQALPFYCIGGAGTHHPLLDDVGNPIYPPRMRLPKRLLGVLPVVRSASDVGSNWDTERLLEDCGFGGQWFDCRDVEGYLSAHGVHLEESFLFPRVDGLNEGGFQSVAANLSPAEQPTTSSEGQLQQIRSAGDTISTVPLRQHILDVETFFLYLLRGMAILGRVPGFRQSDVTAAFKASLRVHIAS